MPGSIITRTYKAGSIIYFEGDKGDSIYVLKEGAIRLISSALDSKEEVHENIKKGEFFGVRPSLGRYPREETAQVLADSTVIVFNPKAFEEICLKNIRLVLQLLKSFSSQLRRIHKQVREQLGEYSNLEVSAELLRVGEYYYKNSETDKAMYVLEKFMESHQSSVHYQRAVTLKQSLNASQPYPDLRDLEASSQTSSLSSENTDLHINVSPQGAAEARARGTTQINISDGPSASKLYYEGLDMVSQDQIDTAIQKFQIIQNIKKFANQEEASFIEKSHTELNKCYLKKKDFSQAILSASNFIKRYPKSNGVKKNLILIAESFEGQKDISKAIVFYNKVADLPPKDKISSMAAKKIEQLKS